MANKHTTAKVNSDKNGHQLSFQQHETDCPILPVPQLQQLQEFKPEAVDWVINQTQIEAEHRRKQNITVNRYTLKHSWMNATPQWNCVTQWSMEREGRFNQHPLSLSIDV